MSMEDDNSHEADDQESVIVDGSEFDFGGCLYRIVQHGTTMTAADRSTCVVSKCVYPMDNNPLYGIEKSFDVRIAKELIERRLYGQVRIHNKQSLAIHRYPPVMTLAFGEHEAQDDPKGTVEWLVLPCDTKIPCDVAAIVQQG